MNWKAGLVAASVLAVAASALAAPSASELMAAPRQFVSSLNDNEIAGAASALTADVTLLDEFAPHAWTGPDAFHHWLSDYAATSKAAHMTIAKVKLGDPIVAQAEGDMAYVVVPASEAYKQDGKRMAESARMAFALRREGGVWKIAALAWAGRRPYVADAGPAKAAPPA